jgi:hypothetical protein
MDKYEVATGGMTMTEIKTICRKPQSQYLFVPHKSHIDRACDRMRASAF